MIKKYIKKPVEISALQWTGDNYDECKQFMSDAALLNAGVMRGKELLIQTLEGALTAQVNDYIIKGIKGEYYPCKPDIFTASYMEVDE